GTRVRRAREMRHAGHRRLVIDSRDEIVRALTRRSARAVGNGDERRREGLELEQGLLELFLRSRRLRREEFERRARTGREDVDDLGHTVGKRRSAPLRRNGPGPPAYRSRTLPLLHEE